MTASRPVAVVTGVGSGTGAVTMKRLAAAIPCAHDYHGDVTATAALDMALTVFQPSGAQR